MRTVLHLLVLVCSVNALCLGSAHASDEQVVFLGDYSHVESASGEHCDGYDVQLWRYKGSVIGFLNHHRGLCGDPPMGMLEDVVYSKSTGDLSFKVRISEGVTSDPAGKFFATKEIITFKGRLSGRTLQGAVSWYSLDRGSPMQTETISLKLEQEAFNSNYDSYEAWMKYWQPILKARGPKW